MNLENLHVMIIRSVFYTSILITIGDIILKLKLSLVNNKDDEGYFSHVFSTLKVYIIVAYMWILLSVLLNYKEHGWLGALVNMVIGLGLNGIFIYFYKGMLEATADKYGFKHVEFNHIDTILTVGYILSMLVLLGWMYYRDSLAKTI